MCEYRDDGTEKCTFVQAIKIFKQQESPDKFSLRYWFHRNGIAISVGELRQAIKVYFHPGTEVRTGKSVTRNELTYPTSNVCSLSLRAAISKLIVTVMS
jgi:hypothetical protein